MIAVLWVGNRYGGRQVFGPRTRHLNFTQTAVLEMVGPNTMLMRVSEDQRPSPTLRIQTTPNVDEAPHQQAKEIARHHTTNFPSRLPPPPSPPPARSGKAATGLSLRSPPSKSGRKGSLGALRMKRTLSKAQMQLWRLIHTRFVLWKKHPGSDSWPSQTRLTM